MTAEGTVAADAIIALVENRMDKAAFAKWIEANSKARPSMELREFFSRLTYKQIAEMLNSGLIDSDAQRAHESRITTMVEAAMAIPAIHEANLGAQYARERGEVRSAVILHGQSHLLTALYSSPRTWDTSGEPRPGICGFILGVKASRGVIASPMI